MNGVSFVVPVLNNERTLRQCLRSIFSQKYPPEFLEVIVVDGGSSDSTVEIARSFPITLKFNPRRTGEAGKKVGLESAKHEFVAFVDSDNILPSDDWLTKMIHALNSSGAVGAEPKEFIYRSSDSTINRSCALYGTADPLSYVIGNSNRISWARDYWSNLSARVLEVRDGYTLVRLKRTTTTSPSIGANGFIGRRSLLKMVCSGDYYFDIDAVHELAKRGYDTFVIVETGTIHLFASSYTSFLRKTYRRIRDYLAFKKNRTYPWAFFKVQIGKFIIFTLLVLPLMRDATKGYRGKPDLAWFFFPFGCIGELYVYGLTYLRFRLLPVK